jgi:hypothetical protein
LNGSRIGGKRIGVVGKRCRRLGKMSVPKRRNQRPALREKDRRTCEGVGWISGPSAYTKDLVDLGKGKGKEMGTVEWRGFYLYLYLYRLSYETLEKAILWFEVKPGPLAWH